MILNILLSVADFTHHVNVSYRRRCELSTALQSQQKDQHHIAISHYCQARSQVGAKRLRSSQILDLKYWTVEQRCHDRVKPSSFHEAVDTWYFSKVFILELSTMACWGASCYHVVIQNYAALSRRGSEVLHNYIAGHNSLAMLRRVVPVGGVICASVALLGHDSLS